MFKGGSKTGSEHIKIVLEKKIKSRKKNEKKKAFNEQSSSLIYSKTDGKSQSTPAVLKNIFLTKVFWFNFPRSSS
jgi:hypothetical protein